MGFVGQLKILFFILKAMEAIDRSEARKVTWSDLGLKRAFSVEWKTDLRKLEYKKTKKKKKKKASAVIQVRRVALEKGANGRHGEKWMVLVLVEIKPVGTGDSGGISLLVHYV